MANFQKIRIGFKLISLLLLLLLCNNHLEANDLTPQSNDLTPQSNGLTPHANDSVYWISDGEIFFSDDSLFYGDDPAPLFRKEFQVKEDLKSAKLLIASAGYYKATINGARVGKNFFDPAWTDPAKRIYYSEYDITESLNNLTNCIGVTLGNGFYNPLPMKMWGRRNLREVLNIGKPRFICKIILKYEDGSLEEIGTNESWKFSDGPIIKNNVYLGEVYNSGQEKNGWNFIDFDDTSWENAKRSPSPGGKLMKSFFPGIEIIENINPLNIYALEDQVYIVDMGVNFAGTYQIKLSGNRGDSVILRFGERIYEDGTLNPMTAVAGQIKSKGQGGAGSPDVAVQSDLFIFGSDTSLWFQPEFTSHTYRYMEISGLKYKPRLNDIVGLALSTNVINENSFVTSSDLINSIQEATRRTFLSNLQSVQSDCPAREKFGYGGDLNATSEAFIYNFDMQSFYRKTIYDWVDAINDSIFVDTAPYVGIEYCGISWESAFLTTQYYLYLYYNDIDIVRELYEYNKRWMDKVARLHPGVVIDFGLGDHESLIPVPVELTGTCHYLQCAEIMREFSMLMDDKSGTEKYTSLAKVIRMKLKELFWDKTVDIEINKQTLYASLLYFDIIPEGEIEVAVGLLLESLKEAPSEHFTTGIFGTKFILEVLSRHVSPGKVMEIVNDRGYPGWGYMIERGATTIWETWKESDNVYSNCHPMFGSVSEWFYRWLGGIKVDCNYPGFEKFFISPHVTDQLDFVKSTYYSPNGKIVSNWKKEDKKIVYEIEIPSGSTAIIKLNKMPTQHIIVAEAEAPGISSIKQKVIHEDIFELNSGKYFLTLF